MTKNRRPMGALLTGAALLWSAHANAVVLRYTCIFHDWAQPTTVDVVIDTTKKSVTQTVSASDGIRYDEDSNQFNGTFTWAHVRDKRSMGGGGNYEETDENVSLDDPQMEWGFDSTRYTDNGSTPMKQDIPYFDFTLDRATGAATWSALRGSSSAGHCTAY